MCRACPDGASHPQRTSLTAAVLLLSLLCNTMIALGLLICVVLRAFSAQAKVVTSFNECKEFFYKGTEPSGMDQNAKRICQMFEDSTRLYYATLYSVPHRIPLYSAYTLDPACSSTPGIYCKDKWYLEPQISQPASEIIHMVRENKNNQNAFKANQAISPDYKNTGYDRGHLNPNSFQCGLGRNATCTLTNAAPMEASFNRYRWSKWESTLKKVLTENLTRDGASAKAYIVTGTVPSANDRIPQGNSDDPERVTVPSHVWTAVCYKHTNDRESFSFSYVGRNQPAESGISLTAVSNLNKWLSEIYSQLSGTPRLIKIFADNCGEDNNKLSIIQKEFQKLINPPVNQGVQMSPCAQNTLGNDYYWHDTVSGNWDYCSSPLRHSKARNGKRCRSNHACGRYGEKYNWCYTDDKDNWDYCCTLDDCYSAVNDQTCRVDHPCGYYGEKYLWCYIDDQGNWDHCCKGCGN
ncbi:hypothetical protein QQF64_036378 [Cirrhinus molitorella]|uniref:Endonuclease domain-containing 1 protein n=1 Tax=Cirrhinus molitorella TaxID=172907 RepID=A0ABR3NIJ3_9TELE